MDDTDSSVSGRAKEYLSRKLDDTKNRISKKKRKRKMVRLLYYSSIILSVTMSALLSALAGLSVLPVYIIPILSSTSGVLTALSAKFNLQNKKMELNKVIEKLHKIQEKLDYVISSNGDFTEENFKELISEISIL